MDTPTILGAALAFSVAALPMVAYLYASGAKKDLTILKSVILEECDRRIKNVEQEIDVKLDKILRELNHKKANMAAMNELADKLVIIANKFENKWKT